MLSHSKGFQERKFFNKDYWIVPKSKQFATQTYTQQGYDIYYGCFIWLILLFDTQLRHALQSYVINPFHLALFHA